MIPKVSVVIPVYKVHQYLIQCIDSVLHQTLKEIEIILVDEGDLDECRAIIDMYEFGPKKDTRVKTIHENNGGYGASVNKGMDIATGEYISIIESDDFIEPMMLEEMYNYAKMLDADVVKTPYNEYWDKTEYLQEKFVMPACYNLVKNIVQNTVFSIEDYPQLMSIHPSIWSALYKTEFLRLNNIRFIDAKGAGYVDNYFRIETLCSTDKICWLNKAYYNYRLTNLNASQRNYKISTFIERWNDVHKMFEEKFQQKWEILAEYCLREEITNVYERILYDRFQLNDKDKKYLEENLKYINSDKLKSIKGLKHPVKRMILELKGDINKLAKYSKSEKSGTIKFLNMNILKFGYKKHGTKEIKLFDRIPLIKVKEQNNNRKKYYFLGIFPIAEVFE